MSVIRECEVHGRYVFPDTMHFATENSLREFDALHGFCKWSTRRCPPKSRKRAAP